MPEAIQTLEEFNFAHLLLDDQLPYVETVTSEFTQLHGGETLYGSNYSDQELNQWAAKIRTWEKDGKMVFVYLNNDAYGFAIKNALTLRKLVSARSSSA